MKNKKIIFIGILVIVLIAILGMLYFTTDLFKTDQQLFYKYLSKTKILNEDFLKQYDIANNRIAKNSNSSKIGISVSSSSQNQETGIADVQEVFAMSSNGLKNTLTKQSYRDFTISNSGQNLLTLKYMRDNNTYAIGADNILVKYLAVENSNLKDLFSKLGVEDTTGIPDSISINCEEILKIDEQTLNYLKETYGMLIYNNISKENFYKITNNDRTQTIGVSLSELEIVNMLKLVLETAKNDNVLLNLILNKVQLLNYTDVTIENIQLFLQENIDEIANETYSTEKDYIKVSLIKKDKTVIKIIIENNYIENAEEKVNTKIEIDFSEANKIIVSAKENDAQLINGTISYLYDNNNVDLFIELNTIENEEINIVKVQNQINNFQTDNIIQKYVIDIKLNNEENFQINISNNVTLKQDIIISKLTTENSAKLNDMTSEELSSLFTAIIARIMSLYGENMINM